MCRYTEPQDARQQRRRSTIAPVAKKARRQTVAAFRLAADRRWAKTDSLYHDAQEDMQEDTFGEDTFGFANSESEGDDEDEFVGGFGNWKSSRRSTCATKVAGAANATGDADATGDAKASFGDNVGTTKNLFGNDGQPLMSYINLYVPLREGGVIAEDGSSDEGDGAFTSDDGGDVSDDALDGALPANGALHDGNDGGEFETIDRRFTEVPWIGQVPVFTDTAGNEQAVGAHMDF